MQDFRLTIVNKIQDCKYRKQSIAINMAVLQKEREETDKHQTDFEILLDQYDKAHEDNKNEIL